MFCFFELLPEQRFLPGIYVLEPNVYQKGPSRNVVCCIQSVGFQRANLRKEEGSKILDCLITKTMPKMWLGMNWRLKLSRIITRVTPLLTCISFHFIFIFVHLIQRGHSPQDIEYIIISIHYTMWHKLQFCHWQQSSVNKCLQ